MALSKQDPRLAFYCEQHDVFSNLTRTYVLLFFYEDRSVEMTEVTRNSLHLRRCPMPSLKKEDFYPGAVLTISGRLVKLTDYADEVTRQLCNKEGEKTVLLIGEAKLPKVGRCLAMLTEECGFTISEMQMSWVEPEMLEHFRLHESLSGGRVVIVSCVRADAVQKGLDYMRRIDGVFAASDAKDIDLWSQLLQQAALNPVAVFGDRNSSVVIVKAHVLKSNAGGAIIQEFVDAGLEPTGLMLVNLTLRAVDACLEAYKGVLPDFEETAKELVGSAWIIQFVSLHQNVDVVSAVRELCGPFDPLIAKQLRPKSIRARFGINRAKNAVHCCDLPEEGPFYAELLFRK